MRIFLSIKKFVISSKYIMEQKRGKSRKLLSEQQCLEICQKLKKGDVSQIKIATEYGISQQTVSTIKCSEMFKSMEEQEVKNKIIDYIMHSNLDKQLHDWCIKRAASGNKIRINWELLKEKALELINNTGGPQQLDTWLHTFVKRHNIQVEYKQIMRFQYCFLKWQLRKHKKVDEQLFNWLLELIILGDKISFDLLKDKTEKLMHEFDGLLNKEALRHWLMRFGKCHEILINSVTLENLTNGGDETDQSDKIGQLATHETNLNKQNIEFKQYNYKQCTSLEKQLVNWLVERKKSGVTISHTMLRDETLKLIIDEFNGSSNKIEEENWLWKIAHRYFLPNSYTFESFHNKIKKIKKKYELNQSEKFIYELNRRLEEENINKNNIYSMIETDAIWKTHVQFLLEYAERKNIKEKIAMEKIDVEKLKNPVTAIFCTNVTGSHILPDYIMDELTYDDQSLQEDVATESRNFTFWYNLFKKSVRKHQLEKNITGKVLLLVDNCTQHILSEEIMQDDDFEILILPINTVSFFKPLYPELINEMNKIFEKDMLKHIDKLMNSYKKSSVKNFNRSYNINLYIDLICKWLLIKTENTEELWRKFLEQCRQKDTLILSTVQLVNYLTKVYS